MLQRSAGRKSGADGPREVGRLDERADGQLEEHLAWDAQVLDAALAHKRLEDGGHVRRREALAAAGRRLERAEEQRLDRVGRRQQQQLGGVVSAEPWA